jgi:hypothetical protein
MDPRKHTNEVGEDEREIKKVKIESIPAEEGPFLDGIIKTETATTATEAAAEVAAANFAAVPPAADVGDKDPTVIATLLPCEFEMPSPAVEEDVGTNLLMS